MSIDLERARRRAARGVAPHQAGMGLAEVIVACALLATGVVSLVGVFTLGIGVTRIQGEVGTRTVVYAQGKMEELLNLDFADTVTDLRVSPSAPAGGTGLLAGGSVDPQAPDPTRVDFVDASGLRVNAAAAAFTRQWQVVDDPAGGMKTITVLVRASSAVALSDRAATLLVSIKSER